MADTIHPFHLPGSCRLALLMVSTTENVLRHEQSLHEDDKENPCVCNGLAISCETILSDIDVQIRLLAQKAGVDQEYMHAAYHAQFTKNLSKEIPDRFIATSADYDGQVEEEELSESEVVEHLEEQDPIDGLFSQMPIINREIRKLLQLVTDLSVPYDPDDKSADDYRRKVGLPKSEYYEMDPSLYECLSAGRAYNEDMSDLLNTLVPNYKDFLSMSLMYRNVEILDKINIDRESCAKPTHPRTSRALINGYITKCCQHLARAFQIPFEVLADTFDRQKSHNTGFWPARERKSGLKQYKVMEQAKAYAIIEALQYRAEGLGPYQIQHEQLVQVMLNGLVGNMHISPGSSYFFEQDPGATPSNYKEAVVKRKGKLYPFVVDSSPKMTAKERSKEEESS